MWVFNYFPIINLSFFYGSIMLFYYYISETYLGVTNGDISSNAFVIQDSLDFPGSFMLLHYQIQRKLYFPKLAKAEGTNGYPSAYYKAKQILASRLPQYHKYLLHISKSMLAS